MGCYLTGDTIFVGTYWGGVYRCGVSASPWEPFSEGLANRFVWELATSPHDGGVIWAASYGGLSVSADTGWTWARLLSQLLRAARCD